ncbi:MAG TPA: hypothetical protein PLZ57_00845 [Pseudobdellovibrionaceae bacterium]|nr:hypothetical protein [Pseudobdellovibrionaceae bacterium]
MRQIVRIEQQLHGSQTGPAARSLATCLTIAVLISLNLGVFQATSPAHAQQAPKAAQKPATTQVGSQASTGATAKPQVSKSETPGCKSMSPEKFIRVTERVLESYLRGRVSAFIVPPTSKLCAAPGGALELIGQKLDDSTQKVFVEFTPFNASVEKIQTLSLNEMSDEVGFRLGWGGEERVSRLRALASEYGIKNGDSPAITVLFLSSASPQSPWPFQQLDGAIPADHLQARWITGDELKLRQKKESIRVIDIRTAQVTTDATVPSVHLPFGAKKKLAHKAILSPSQMRASGILVMPAGAQASIPTVLATQVGAEYELFNAATLYADSGYTQLLLLRDGWDGLRGQRALPPPNDSMLNAATGTVRIGRISAPELLGLVGRAKERAEAKSDATTPANSGGSAKSDLLMLDVRKVKDWARGAIPGSRPAEFKQIMSEDFAKFRPAELIGEQILQAGDNWAETNDIKKLLGFKRIVLIGESDLDWAPFKAAVLLAQKLERELASPTSAAKPTAPETPQIAILRGGVQEWQARAKFFADVYQFGIPKVVKEKLTKTLEKSELKKKKKIREMGSQVKPRIKKPKDPKKRERRSAPKKD